MAAASWGDAEWRGGEGGCCTSMEKYLAAICGHRWVFLLTVEFWSVLLPVFPQLPWDEAATC